MTSENPLIEELRKLTGEEKMEAAEGLFYLEICEGNVESAATLYREQNSGSSKLSPSPSALLNDSSALVNRQRSERGHPLRSNSDGAAITGRRRARVDHSADLVTSSLNTSSFAEPGVGLVSNPRNRSMKFMFQTHSDFQEVAMGSMSLEDAMIASKMDASHSSSEPGSGLVTSPSQERVPSYGNNLELSSVYHDSLPEKDDSDLDAAIAASLNECVATELHETLKRESKEPWHASPDMTSSSNEQYSKTKRAAATGHGVVRAILHPDTVEEPTLQASFSHQSLDQMENASTAAKFSTNLDEKSGKLRKMKPASRPAAISTISDREMSSLSEVPGGKASTDAFRSSSPSPSSPTASLDDKNSKVKRAPATVPGVFSVSGEHAVIEPSSIRETMLSNIVKRQSRRASEGNIIENGHSEDPDTKINADIKPKMSRASASGAIGIGPKEPVRSPDLGGSSQRPAEKTKSPVQLPALQPGVVRVHGDDAKERQTKKEKIKACNNSTIASQARGSRPGIVQATNENNQKTSNKEKSSGHDGGKSLGPVHVSSKEAAKMSKYGKNKSNKEKGRKPGAVHTNSKQASKVSKTIKYGLSSSNQQTKVQIGALSVKSTVTADENRNVPLVQHVVNVDEDPIMVKGEREITIPGTAPSASTTIVNDSPVTSTEGRPRPSRPRPLPVQPPLPGIRRADRHKRRGLFGGIFKKKEKNVTS